jgi:hypothetical protein
MQQHDYFNGETSNRFVLWNQERYSRLFKNLNQKSIDDLRYLVTEFKQASEFIHFSEREWTWFDLARVRLAQLEAAAALLAQLEAPEAA